MDGEGSLNTGIPFSSRSRELGKPTLLNQLQSIYNLKMRLRLAFTLLISLTLIAPASAASNPKSGTSCKSVGSTKIYQGKKFTCIKNGKKSTWNKGVLINKGNSSTPKSENVPTPSPSPTKILTIAERWNALDSSALTAAQKWMLVKRSDSHSVNFIFKGSERSNSEVMNEIQRRYARVAKFWEPYAIVKNPLLVVVGDIGEIDWICREKLAWLAPWNQPDCVEVEGKGDWSNGTAGQSQTLTKNIDMYTIDTLKRLDSVGYLARIEHEFMHNIFHAINDEYNRTMPCWMIESGAEYFGVLTASGEDFTRFIQLRNYQSQRQNLVMKGATESGWYNYLIRTDRTDLNRPLNEDACGEVRNEIYSHAFLANEYIVSKVGLDGYLELIRFAKSLGWSKAIESKFVKSREDVYRDMARYMKGQFELILDNPWSHSDLMKK